MATKIVESINGINYVLFSIKGMDKSQSEKFIKTATENYNGMIQEFVKHGGFWEDKFDASVLIPESKAFIFSNLESK